MIPVREIDLMKYLSLENCVLLEDEFREKLFEKVLKKVGVDDSTISSWKSGKKNQIRIRIIIPHGNSITAAKELTESIIKSGYTHISYATDKYFTRRNFTINFWFYSKILAQFLKSFMKNLNKNLEIAPPNIKAAYLRGFCAAEGAIFKTKNYRRVTITQKDPKELEFMKSLLNGLGIKNISAPIRGVRAYTITITTKDELVKFQKLVGFGHHSNKNKILSELINGYKNRSRIERYKEILELMKTNENASTIEIVNTQKVSKRYARQLLREAKEYKGQKN